MYTFILVILYNSQVSTAPVTFPSIEACQRAGKAWVDASAKLRGMVKGDFVCVPAEKA